MFVPFVPEGTTSFDWRAYHLPPLPCDISLVLQVPDLLIHRLATRMEFGRQDHSDKIHPVVRHRQDSYGRRVQGLCIFSSVGPQRDVSERSLSSGTGSRSRAARPTVERREQTPSERDEYPPALGVRFGLCVYLF